MPPPVGGRSAWYYAPTVHRYHGDGKISVLDFACVGVGLFICNLDQDDRLVIRMKTKMKIKIQKRKMRLRAIC